MFHAVSVLWKNPTYCLSISIIFWGVHFYIKGTFGKADTPLALKKNPQWIRLTRVSVCFPLLRKDDCARAQDKWLFWCKFFIFLSAPLPILFLHSLKEHTHTKKAGQKNKKRSTSRSAGVVNDAIFSPLVFGLFISFPCSSREGMGPARCEACRQWFVPLRILIRTPLRAPL